MPIPRIGDHRPSGRFFLAPMEGVTRRAFRTVCSRRGASIVTTDMIDADTFCGIADARGEDAAIRELIDPRDEGPLSIQLGGANPRTLVRAARILEPYAVIIDLNSGCPVGSTFEAGGGCTLMRDPERLYAIATRMRAALKAPFTVKLRKGWDRPQAIEIASVLEKIGIDAVTIHPRTREQRYRERADWGYARDLKRAIGIPVTLSGDVTNASSARDAFETTGCDFIMIGRAAKNNPSIFRHLDADTGIGRYGKSGNEPIEDFLEWYDLASEGYLRLSTVRDHALWSVSEAKNARDLKRSITRADSPREIIGLVTRARFPNSLKPAKEPEADAHPRIIR